MAKTTKTAGSSKSAALNTSKSGTVRKQSRSAMDANDFTRLLMSGASNEAMEKMMSQSKSQFDKLAQEASDMGREGMEAFIKSGSIFAKGFEDIFRQTIAIAQSAAEKQSQLMKDAMSSKTLNEWTEIQSRIAQENFDDFMAGATKISELSAKLLTESSEPINAQMTKGIKKASEAIAA